MQRLSKNEVTQVLAQALPARINEIMYSRVTTHDVEYCLPTRECTDKVHLKWYRAQPAQEDYGHRTVYFLRGTTVSGLAIRRKLSKWMKTNNSRFKFRTQLCYRIWKEHTAKTRCWRIIYPSQNKAVNYEGTTAGGWYNVYDNNSAQQARLSVHGHDYVSEIRITDADGSSWKLGLSPFLSYHIEVMPLPGNLMGCVLSLPELYTGVEPFTGFEDQLCFWRCLAMNQTDAWKTLMKKMFRKFYGISKHRRTLKKQMKEYPGVDYPYEFDKIQKVFKVSIFVYEPVEKNGLVVPKQLYPVDSPKKHKTKLYLAKYKQHFALITDTKAFARNYLCDKCGRMFPTLKKQGDHCRKCLGKQSLVFAKMQKTKEETKLPYFKFTEKKGFGEYFGMCAWDVETLQRDRGVGDRTVIRSEHWLLSYSVARSLMNGSKPKEIGRIREIHQTEKSFTTQFFKDCLEHHKQVVLYNYGINYDRLVSLKRKISKIKVSKKKSAKERKQLSKPDLATEIKLDEKRSKKEGLKHYYNKYLLWLINVPMYGFNSKGFDMHFIKGSMPIFNDVNFITDHLQNIFGKERACPRKLEFMIKSYWDQDVHRFGDFKEEGFITIKWILDTIEAVKEKFGNLKCAWCDRIMTMNPDLKHQNNMLTVDRLDNSTPHYQDRCVLSCLKCNCHDKIGRVARRPDKLKLQAEQDLYTDTLEAVLAVKKKCTIIKQNNNFKLVFSTFFNWKDIMNMSSPMRLRDFLKCWGASSEKAWLCYEFIKDLSILDHKGLPPIEEWNSWLTSTEMKPENYKICQKLFKKHKCKTLGDFVQVYNSLDTIPLLEAMENMNRVFKGTYDVDFLRDFCSIGQLAEHLAMKAAHTVKGGYCEELFPYIPKENEALWDIFKRSKLGGCAQVFHRYEEAGKTKLPNGQLCKTILGFDVHSLYPFCMAHFPMPCKHFTHVKVDEIRYETSRYLRESGTFDANLTEQFLICAGLGISRFCDRVLKGKFFGFCVVDIFMPKKYNVPWLKANFFPLFDARIVDPQNTAHVGAYTFNWLKENEIRKHKSRKLLNTSYGVKITLISEYLKQLLQWGAKITKIYDIIHFKKTKCFKSFVDTGAQLRRTGDVAPQYAPRAATAKLVITSSYGRFQMDTTRHKTHRLVDEEQLVNEQYSPFYVDKQALGNERYEVERVKERCSMKQLIYLGIATYQYSKLHYVRFIWHLITHLREGSWRMLSMDTDAAYISLDSETLEGCVKPDMLKSWKAKYFNFFPRTDDGYNSTLMVDGKPYNITNAEYDERRPGPWGLEKVAYKYAGTSAKATEYMGHDYLKSSRKGIQESRLVAELAAPEWAKKYLADENPKKKLEAKECEGLWQATYDAVMDIKETSIQNRGIRVENTKDGSRLTTYSQYRLSHSHYYDKMHVQPDKITCKPGILNVRYF